MMRFVFGLLFFMMLAQITTAAPVISGAIGFRFEESVRSGLYDERPPVLVEGGWNFGALELVVEAQNFTSTTKVPSLSIERERWELMTWGRYMPTVLGGSIEPFLAAGLGALWTRIETRLDNVDGTQVDNDNSRPQTVGGLGLGLWMGKDRGWGGAAEMRFLRSAAFTSAWEYEGVLRIGYRF
jgi:hypothetical protein